MSSTVCQTSICCSEITPDGVVETNFIEWNILRPSWRPISIQRQLPQAMESFHDKINLAPVKKKVMIKNDAKPTIQKQTRRPRMSHRHIPGLSREIRNILQMAYEGPKMLDINSGTPIHAKEILHKFRLSFVGNY